MPLNGWRFARVPVTDWLQSAYCCMARGVRGMSHGRVLLSCSSSEAKPGLLLTRIICVQPCAQGHAAAWGHRPWGEQGSAWETPVPPAPVEADASTATRQSEPSSPGGWTWGFDPSVWLQRWVLQQWHSRLCCTRPCSQPCPEFHRWVLFPDLDCSWAVQLGPHPALGMLKSSNFVCNTLHWSELCSLW